MRNYFGNESGDSFGNRKSTKESRVPYDGIGNYLESDLHLDDIPDQIGNSVHIAPTHLQSNVSRRRSDQVQTQRVGKYIMGGVNPLVTGVSHAVAENAPASVETATATPKSQVTQAQNDKRLRRLFEFDEDERVEYTLTSTPEEKRAQVEQVVKTIFDFGGAPTELNAVLNESAEKPSVAVTVKTSLFKNDELPWAALNFLVNKIVNRVHSDRIKLSMSIA